MTLRAIFLLFMLLAMVAAVPDGPRPITAPPSLPVHESAILVPPAPDGYGFDYLELEMTDHTGFVYEYLGDGVMSVTTPKCTVRFSFGMTGIYNGVPQIRTAMDYSWTWQMARSIAYNETGETALGYDFDFWANSTDPGLLWSIHFEFFALPGYDMKITHTITSALPLPVSSLQFWYIFDTGFLTERQVQLLDTVYCFDTLIDIPDNATWLWLQGACSFNFRDILAAGFPMGQLFIGDGAIIGVPGIPIVAVSVLLPDLLPGASVSIDPYFSGITKTWDAPAAGAASVATNWSPDGVPGTGDQHQVRCDFNQGMYLGYHQHLLRLHAGGRVHWPNPADRSSVHP